ncbi:MAG: DUF3089 domain-containing protein [Burkholderiales bacterium]|nr:DUF3089 domain-containing protein [Burkholderiales bacterium]
MTSFALRACLQATALATLLACCTLAQAAQEVPTADPYQNDDAWLCRPGHEELCRAPSDVTRVAADGALAVDSHAPAQLAPIDCFYVYPTVSRDPHGNAPLAAGPAERRVVAAQFAPFAAVCRAYAPLYRQLTLANLEGRLTGRGDDGNPELAYRDVLTAWQHYLQHDNHGRGVVLIGHSQGARILARLMQETLDGKPEQSLLVAAIIPGYGVEVPKGKDIGGTFQHIPLCSKTDQMGCVISYATFRAETPPPPSAHFGRTQTEGMEVACVDPTTLTTGALDMRLPTEHMAGDSTSAAWATLAASVKTPFYALPGVASVQCVHDAHGSYLALSNLPRATGDIRPTDLPGDVVVRGNVLYSWGLHPVDINLLLGNLIDFVGRHSRAADAVAHAAPAGTTSAQARP